MPDYHPRALPDIHDIAVAALGHCGTILYGLRVVREIAFFCFLKVANSVKKVKTIGGHGQGFLARHDPDKPGNTDGFEIERAQGARFLEESRND